MQPRLPVQVLALEAQVLLLLRLGLWRVALVQRVQALARQALDLPFLGDRAAPGPVAGLPDQLALAVAQLLGHAHLVRVEVVDLAQPCVVVACRPMGGGGPAFYLQILGALLRLCVQ